MKNILIIVAHPKKNSLSFAIANKYKEKMSNYNVEILDLYRDENQQEFFTYENTSDLIQTSQMKYYQDKILHAHELVFIFPYWWGTFPAILKNFFDWNLSKGFAFEYINSRPKGLLQNKTVKVFTTTGAPKFIYTITGANRRLKNMFTQQIIKFCGMKLKEFHIFGGVNANNKNSNKILDSI